jgi:predicted GNAT family N-acyltransferase
MVNMPAFNILTSSHNRDDFHCGEPALDSYIRERARLDQKRRMCQVYVIEEGSTIIGFYTLSAHAIDGAVLPPKIAKKYPSRLKIPSCILGRLAVDSRYQGQHYGYQLLGNALTVARNIAAQIGCFCVIVDAKNESVCNFYMQYGFMPVIDDELRLYLPVDSITL